MMRMVGWEGKERVSGRYFANDGVEGKGWGKVREW